MSDASQGPGWWLASDGKWYSPHLEPGWATEEPVSVSAPATSPSYEATAARTPSGFQATAPSSSSQNWSDDWSVNRTPDVPARAAAATGAVSSPKQGRASNGRSRRKLIPAIVAIVVLLGAGGAVAVAMTRVSGPSLTGKSPEQILQASLAAARSADSLRLTQSGSEKGQTANSTSYVGPDGATAYISVTGLPDLDDRIVLVNSKIYVQANGLFWSFLLKSNLVRSRLLGHWIEVPASNPDISKLASHLNLHNIVSSLALSGPISETTSGSGAATSVTLHGKLPLTPTTIDNGVGAVAALTVSTTAPYYPLAISFQDKQVGSVAISLGNWNQTQLLPSVAGALPLSSLEATSVKPTTKTNLDDALTQSNLRSALAAAQAYSVKTRRNLSGLDRASSASVDLHRTIVAGSFPSSGPTVISLVAGSDYAVLAAWSPATQTCWAVVDNEGRNAIDGVAGPATAFAVSLDWRQPACRAVAFSASRPTTNSLSSTTRFP